MKKDKKQQKFHDALLQMLYPPPPSPDPPQDEEEDNKLYNLPEDLENYESDESPSISEDNEEENVSSEKLTRAQRKRLRKKKMKETASQRRKIIGPLLPCSGDDESDRGGSGFEYVPEAVRQNAAEGNVPETVRQNAAEIKVMETVRQNAAEGNVPETVRQKAAEGDNDGTDSSGDRGSCSKQRKLKQRRKSKKMAGGKLSDLSSSSIETSASTDVKDHQLGSNDERVDP